MNQPLRLHDIASRSGDPDCVVAVDESQNTPASASVIRRMFWRSVDDWRHRYEELRLGPGSVVGIAIDAPFDFAAAFAAALEMGIRSVILPDTRPATLQAASTRVDGWATSQAPPPALGAPPLASEIVLEIYTSGSTGEPTCHAKAWTELEGEITAIERTLGAGTAGALVCSTVTHLHMYGLAFGILWPLLTGRPFAARRASVWSLLHPPGMELSSARPRIVITSPAHLSRLPAHRSEVAPPVLITSAGSPLPPETARRCAEVLGRVPTEIYGSSELGAFAHRQSGPWRPLESYQFKVDADQMLWARLGIGWEQTPDRARHDGEGFSLLGRADRIVKVESTRVSLDHVERRAIESSLVSGARAVHLETRRPERPRECLGLVIVPSSEGLRTIATGGRSAFSSALKLHLSAELHGPALPRLVRFVDAIPTDSLGKSRTEDMVCLFDVDASPLPPGRLTTSRADLVVRETAIPRDLPSFDGHFEGHPVLPGVEQLRWALELLRAAGETRSVRGMNALKFKAVVRPGEILSLSVQRMSPSQWLFEFRRDEVVVSTGRLDLVDPGEPPP